MLFDLNADPGENYDIASEHPDVVAELAKLRDAHKATIEPVEDQLAKCKPISRMCPE